MRFFSQILLSFFLLLSWGSYAQIPNIDGQTTDPNPIVINEDQNYTVAFGDLQVTDADDPYSTNFTLTVLSGSNYSFSVGDVTITPDQDFNGMLSVNVQVTDPSGNPSNIFPLQVQVNAVNDEPTFVIGSNQTILEDAGAQSIANWATAISAGPLDESSQVLSFGVTNTDNALFSVQPAISTTGTLTYTAVANISGSATVTVVLSDGIDSSPSQDFIITITSVNDAPTFVKGLDQNILEDAGAQSITNWATAISAGPPDESSQVLSFSLTNTNNALFSAQPAISTTGTLAYTAAANTSGSAVVTIVLSDGIGGSSSQDFIITVTGVNDAPTFVKGLNQVVNEGASAQTLLNWATAISAGPSDETGQTFSFGLTNNNNALFSVQPAIDATGTLTYAPAANTSGSATVTVTLSDNGGTANGGINSSSQTFTITVNNINSAPTFVKGLDQNILEDAGAQSITNWATAISAGPPDESLQTLSFGLTNTNNALFSIQPALSATGTLTYTPAANISGSATVTVTLSDNGGTANGGIDNSSQNFLIAVTSVNDAPSFVKGSDQVVSEGASAQTVTNWATAISAGPADESGQVLSFSVTNNNNALFSAQPAINASGMLTYTPAANTSGSATVTVTLSDNGGNANGGIDTFTPQTFTITITPINHEPSFVVGANPLILEDAGPQTVVNWATSISAGAGDVGQTLTFTLTNNNNGLFSVQPTINPTTGTLTYTTTANASGLATVSVVLTDNGGVLNGGDDTFDTKTFTITVTAVNDKPFFTNGANQTVLEDAAAQTVAGWATAISAGPADESAQTLSFVVTNNNNGLFSVQPAISPTGTLTYTPLANASGIATVTVVLSDNGGTANGGVNTFTAPTFTIAVTPVNDAPSITGQTPNPINVTEDIAFTLQVSNLVISDVDNSSFSLTVLPGTNYTFSGNTVTPTLNYNGSLTVNVKVSDGSNDSPSFGVAVQITPVNDAPVIIGQASLSTGDGQPITLKYSDLTVFDPDNTYPTGFDLSILSGANYSVSGLTITPTVGYSGNLTVRIFLDDGIANGPIYNLTIQVNYTNKPPTITGQTPNPIGATEDTPFTPLVSNLTITDPDNTTFSMTVLPGTNYTFSGNTITPALNYNGPLTVNVKVNDGAVDSPTFGLAVQVAAVNDAPTIASQTPNPIPATEDTPFTLLVSNLNVTDVDNSVFTLTVLAGTNYTFSGNDVTPALNYNGPLTVNVKVNDGTVDSPSYGVAVQVGAVNDAPTITGQTPNPITATQNTPFTILVSNVNVSDPDNSVFTLTVLAGTNYTFSGNTVTPALNFNGALSVNVRVSDGSANSPSFGVAVSLSAVNVPPSITGQTPNPISVAEDTPLTIQVSNLTIVDPDNSVFTLTVFAGTNYTFSGNTITPAPNYSGPLTVNVKVNDGTANSPNFGVAVLATPVNDAPVITGQSSLSINEEQSLTIAFSHLVVSDPDNTYPTGFTLFVLPGTDYTGVGNVIKPNLNYNGTLSVQVFVSDGAANSAIYNLQVVVKPVNDVPVIVSQLPVNTNEDQAKVITLANLQVTDPDNTYPTGFTLTILAGTNYTFSGTTITPALNFTGTLSVNVKVNDGVADSAPFSLQVTVDPVNDPPVITGQPVISINEDVVITLQFSNITVTDPDNTYPAGFSMTALGGSNYDVSGLTITPKLNFNGLLTIPVTVSDGALLSNTFNLKITVVPVNDLPVFVSNPVLTANIGEPYTYGIKVTDVEKETLVLTAPSKPTWATLSIVAVADTAACHCNYKLSGTPPVGSGGSIAVKLQVKDPSNVLVDQSYTLVVNTRPTTIPVAVTTNEDVEININASKFSTGFIDADGNALSEVQIITLPKHGSLKINGGALVTVGQKISADLLSNGLVYSPMADYYGPDTVNWNASDGISYALNGSYINMVVTPVNDVPIILPMETDSLLYKSGSEPLQVTKIFEAKDIDNDSLMSAEVRFVPGTFYPPDDILVFTKTANLTGNFNADVGILSISGKAPISEYDSAIRAIKYKNDKSISPDEGLRTVSITVSDGKSFSEPKTRLIYVYFVEVALDIPDGFTPGDDGTNDKWEIWYQNENLAGNPNPELKDAVLKVYNSRGLLLFETSGFQKEWDGKVNGEFVPADTYYYTIDLKSSSQQTFKGTVTVLR